MNAWHKPFTKDADTWEQAPEDRRDLLAGMTELESGLPAIQSQDRAASAVPDPSSVDVDEPELWIGIDEPEPREVQRIDAMRARNERALAAYKQSAQRVRERKRYPLLEDDVELVACDSRAAHPFRWPWVEFETRRDAAYAAAYVGLIVVLALASQML